MAVRGAGYGVYREEAVSVAEDLSTPSGGLTVENRLTRIPGVVEEGHGHADESMVTGEPVPVEEKPGRPSDSRGPC